MDHTGFTRPVRCSLGQLSEEGVIGNSHPVRKKNSKVSDHSQILIELLNKFGNGLATMIPIIKQDTLQARPPATGSAHHQPTRPIGLPSVTTLRPFMGSSSWVVEVGQKANQYGEHENMSINIKHKHAGHLIIIEGQLFKANDAGMWDLTEVWQTLKLPKGKQPGRWRGKEKDRLAQSQNLDVRNLGAFGHQVTATKRATIEYAGWVSPEFKNLVYDAFEAILEMPEVALLVADKMRSIGHNHSSIILEQHIFNDRCNWKAFNKTHKNSQEGLRAAVKLGHITQQRAIELGLKHKGVRG